MNKTTRILLVLLSLPAILTAGTGGFEQLTTSILADSLDYEQALLEYDQLVEQLTGTWLYEQSSLSLKSQALLQSGGSTVAGELSLAVPLTDRLSLRASLDQNLSGSFSVEYSPFYRSTRTIEEEYSLLSATAGLEERADSILSAAFSSLLTYLRAQNDYEIALMAKELYDGIYQDMLLRYEAGDIGFEELFDASIDAKDSQNTLLQARIETSSRQAALYEAVGEDHAQQLLSLIDQIDLETLIQDVEDRHLEELAQVEESNEVTLARLTLQKAQSLAELTTGYVPELVLSSSVNYNPLTVTPSFSFSISLTDFDTSEQLLTSREIELYRKRLEAAIEAVTTRIDTITMGIDLSRQQYQLAVLQLEQQQTLLEESEFLYEGGELSTFEYELSLLAFHQTEMQLTGSIYTLLASYLDLAEVVPDFFSLLFM